MQPAHIKQENLTTMSVPARNPYRALVSGYAALLNDSMPLLKDSLSPATPIVAGKPKLMLFSPHPDDECIVGGLALRLQRQCQWQVINIAVTLGSRQTRRAERWRELQNACAYLGFELLASKPDGLDNVNLDHRAQAPDSWSVAVETVVELLLAQRPQAVFVPHAEDWNRTHIGTHYLVLDALARLPASFSCFVIETEFWGAMQNPNVLVEISVDELADLIYALALHRGEVARNPYHLRLPAWMIDNVRRGAEVVGGQGVQAPDFTFATLYRVRHWRAGQLHDVHAHYSSLACYESADRLFKDTGK